MAAREETIAVRGLAPLLRDFSKISRTATKAIRGELRLIAEPVAVDIKFRERGARFGARTVSGVRVIVRQRGVSVEQTRGKSADLPRRRANFGALQMTKAFIPGLEDNADAIERRVGEFLDKFLDAKTGSLL